MAQKTETVFRQNQVIPFLKTLRNTWFEPIQQKAIVGSPDFVLCVQGRFVALELKADSGSLSKLQEFKLAKITSSGGHSLVAAPNNWVAIKEQLSAMDQGEKWKSKLSTEKCQASSSHR